MMKRSLSSQIFVVTMLACAGLALVSCAKPRADFFGKPITDGRGGESADTEKPNPDPTDPPAFIASDNSAISLSRSHPELIGTYRFLGTACMIGETTELLVPSDNVMQATFTDNLYTVSAKRADGCELRKIKPIVGIAANASLETEAGTLTTFKDGEVITADDRRCWGIGLDLAASMNSVAYHIEGNSLTFYLGSTCGREAENNGVVVLKYERVAEVPAE